MIPEFPAGLYVGMRVYDPIHKEFVVIVSILRNPTDPRIQIRYHTGAVFEMILGAFLQRYEYGQSALSPPLLPRRTAWARLLDEEVF